MKKILVILQLGLCGLSIGWLVGMSTSPLLQGILASIMTLLVTILSIVSGISENLEKNNSTIINVLKANDFSAITAFVFFLALGSGVGIYTRSNELIGVNPDTWASKWESKANSRDQIKQRLFNKLYSKDSLNEQKQKELESVLFSVSSDQCSLLKQCYTVQELLTTFKMLENSDVRIAKIMSNKVDSISLFALRDSICK